VKIELVAVFLKESWRLFAEAKNGITEGSYDRLCTNFLKIVAFKRQILTENQEVNYRNESRRERLSNNLDLINDIQIYF
jgi:endonuclease IV